MQTIPAQPEKQRIVFTASCNIRYELNTPYRDGTTQVIFESLDFIVRLAALVPPPCVNLIRYHGVFAPNSQHRVVVTPGKRGKANQSKHADEVELSTPFERRAAMTWAQCFKRVFNIDIEVCTQFGGSVKVIASICRMHVPHHKASYLIRENRFINAGTLSEKQGKGGGWSISQNPMSNGVN